MKKILFAVVLCWASAINAAAEQTNTVVEKTALCVACHGQQGISVNPQWPNLAGQHASYLLKQLKDYKNITTRNVPVMTAIVANLSDADMAALAEYYAKQPLGEGATPEKYLKRGEQLYRGGDFKKHITACIACHGPRGTGNGQAGFPLLSGQHAPYTIQQLQAFKDKKRSNDLNAIMRDISERMSQEDMEAVAYYIQGLH
ncbi:cytochrome c4 [Legionella lansingensis]|uniref:Cytochrome c4 n=1 Tax=Legionella lansingensis TaxID=45067 RepID=A0A0W0VLG5_9GAMM|nr:c-type cytochrome [Legionella lansingensis]KTD20940.1 cytochrome c4 [Legionella lansingensis]SNV44409.1 cytochrome c4 [Legionella lansingensis]